MAWNEDRARRAVREFVRDNPVSDVLVETYQERSLRKLAEAKQNGASTDPLINLPYNRAVTTHGVHVYARLIRFDEFVENELADTENGQAQLLSFLHTHYSACDRLVEEFGIQRVDFHGGRLHAVVLQPAGDTSELERVGTALSFAAAFRSMVSRSFELASTLYSDVAIGIDSGIAIAINSGRKPEQEPLFVGNPANTAAHLADPDVPGIRLSDRVQELVSKAGIYTDHLGVLSEHAEEALVDQYPGEEIRGRVKAAINEHLQRAKRNPAGSAEAFKFHSTTPPLRQIKFAELMPSNSIRVELAALFADICGYSKFVDTAIATDEVGRAVHALHVIRKEFVRVTREEFGGRKVRFIGDCLHGLIAEGTGRNIDKEATATTAVLLAAALRSSFEICREELGTITELGLSVGTEFGVTPVTRLGFRGERSVRCSASSATSTSERLQNTTQDNTIIVGSNIYRAVGPGLKQMLVGPERPCDAYYADAERFVDASANTETQVPAPTIVRSHTDQ